MCINKALSNYRLPQKKQRLKRLFRIALQFLTQPCCMVGPKLFFSKYAYLNMHRDLVFKSMPTHARWQWVIILFSSATIWYLFSVWWQLFKCARMSMSVVAERYNVARSRQWVDLFYLGLWLGVAPRDYYRLSLHQFARNRWCRFVFMQEQQTWHGVHSYQKSATSFNLSNKFECEQRLRNAGLTCVQTIDLVTQGDVLSEKTIFQRQSCFIKPQSSNAMRGCVLLEYDSESDSYSLIGNSMKGQPIFEHSQAGILQQLKQILKRDSLLIQEVLNNSKTMSEFCRNEELVTLRLISCRVHQAIEFAYAFLEVPSDQPQIWCIYPLDIDTGVILDWPKHQENCLNLAKTNQSLSVPCWTELQALVRDAHLLYSAFKSIAWDLCVTESGACLIEGNSGWGLVPPQIISGIPLLETKLYEAYMSSSSRH